MRIKFVAAAFIALSAFPASGALVEGAVAPDFKALASIAGTQHEFSLKEALAKGPVVVYFYPSAFTNGCNLQAHTFAELSSKFGESGASIVGVSLDSIERLNAFSADPDFCGGKVAVASDKDGRIARSYDLEVRESVPGRRDTRGEVIDHGRVDRVTYVIDSAGRVAATIQGVGPVENVEKALEAVRKLSVK